MITSNNRPMLILGLIALVLLTPFVAMLFSSEVNWGPADFLVAGILLSATGLVCELFLRKVKSLKYRILFCGLALTVCLLVWAELAVGIFGSPLAGS